MLARHYFFIFINSGFLLYSLSLLAVALRTLSRFKYLSSTRYKLCAASFLSTQSNPAKYFIICFRVKISLVEKFAPLEKSWLVGTHKMRRTRDYLISLPNTISNYAESVQNIGEQNWKLELWLKESNKHKNTLYLVALSKLGFDILYIWNHS